MTVEYAAPALTMLSEEEQDFRRMLRDFAEAEIKPHVHEMDQAKQIKPELVQQLHDLGVMGIEAPEVYGGAAGTFFMAILAVEEVSRVDASMGVFVDVQNTLVINALMRWGSEGLKERFITDLCSGHTGAYALSEPSSGSDAFALKTRAAEDGDAYVLNGTKMWITNGAEASRFIMFANADPDAGYKGITAFIVERDMPGFTVGKKEDKLGIRASSTCELVLEDVRVPKANILGEVGRGYKVAIETLNEGRIGIGAQMVGITQAALEAGLAYAQEREQFGKPIAGFQAIQFQLAECATDLEAARLMVYNAARLKDAGQSYVKEAAMAKYFSSQVAERVTSQMVEVFGGYGFTTEYPVEKFFRDSKIGKIYEGTSFMQLQTIAKLLLAG